MLLAGVDDQIDIRLDFIVDRTASKLQVEPGLVVMREREQQLQRQPFLEVHDLPVVLRRVLAVGLVETSPDGVPNVERQHACLDVELPEPTTALEEFVGEPEADLWMRCPSAVVAGLLGRVGDNRLALGTRLGLVTGPLPALVLGW